MRIVTVLALGAILAVAQSGSRFDVVSIKPSTPQSQRGSDGGPGSKDPGRYTFQSATLLDLLSIAYEVDSFQISSKAPLDNEHFDLLAKLPENTAKPDFRIMMQNLLAERFHLKLHQQTREFPTWQLVVAKGGPKLKESTEDSKPMVREGFPQLSPGRPGIAVANSMSGGYALKRLNAYRVTMPLLVRFLRPGDDRPVVDKTGLTGSYDFMFEFAADTGAFVPGGAAADPPGAPSIFTALQPLGLQLVDRKTPFNVLIIDSFDKQPTEN